MNPKPSNFVYWLLSVMLALAAIGSIGYKWRAVKPVYRQGQTTVANAEELKKALTGGQTKEFNNDNGPTPIPIGFFIQSFSFVNANDVNFNGYIWMKFPKTLPTDFAEGFIFPEEVNSSATKIYQIYTEHLQDYDLVGWYFDVTVRQAFDYGDYPLDFHAIWLRIWSREFINDEESILVPDFEAYDLTAVAANRFGMDVDIVPSGWQIVETFFSYKQIPYDTSFGIAGVNTNQEYTELFFNIGINRSFVDAFIINLVPLFFVVLLLFGMIMTVTGDETRKTSFGYNTVSIVGICASLLFVVILLHIQVRSQHAGSQMVYIEYFYLIVYLVIFLTALNSYLFSLGRRRLLAVVHFRDNFIPKVTYWPVVLGMMSLATWLKL